MAKYGLTKYGADSPGSTLSTGSMNGSSLLTALRELTGETITWDTALPWFNDAISELTDKLKIEAKTTITTTSGTSNYPIPSDCLSIVKCDKTFTTWANEISFDSDPGTGTVDLYYYRKVNKLSLETDIPTDIPENYHYALVLFGAMRFKQSDEETEQAQGYERQFNNKKSLMIEEIRNKVRQKTVKAVYYDN
ncbi:MULTISPECIES: hypothetical protein [unclassified Dehalobacter]|jgi:hypothetical protein|uniref:phage adaptor protein n=1 Tax=unclassified Dehalobacter TaxID=2635733 RepID=UPI00028B95AC|nr:MULTISPECIES: hypothetical protein [unclassified Dehalobacter]AFV02819.1 hypothetical protein DHBDCA_p1793 [Dehalobacter sp. DCA]AFV05805.1 hypothetical protein DCF50_p1803 [Dehalobacter sp. CF]